MLPHGGSSTPQAMVASMQDFLKVYDVLREELMADPLMQDQPETARTWFRKVW